MKNLMGFFCIFSLLLINCCASRQIGNGFTVGGNTGTNSGWPVTIPGGATANLNLEQQSGWTTDASSSISPNPPTSYAIVPTGGGGSTMTLQTANTANDYAGWMAKLTVGTTSGQLHFLIRSSFTFSSVSGIQAWEIGRRATNNAQVTDNGQTQLVPIGGGQLEFDIVPSSSGGWVDTGIRFPMFVIGTTYNEELYYIADTSGGLSLEYVMINGALYPIPSNLQNVAGAIQMPSWGANEMVVAFQPDIKPLGTAYNAVVTMNAWTW